MKTWAKARKAQNQSKTTAAVAAAKQFFSFLPSFSFFFLLVFSHFSELLQIVLARGNYPFLVLFLQLPQHLGRHSGNQAARWHFHPLGDHRACGNYAPLPNDASVKQGGVHPNQAIVPNLAAMHNGAMPHRHIVSDAHACPMDNAALLYAGIIPNLYLPFVRAKAGKCGDVNILAKPDIGANFAFWVDETHART
jgi:hypothetical protein